MTRPYGVRLPIGDDIELLDSKYVDDTTLYVQDVESLERERLALEVFSLAVGAKINWHKLVGFLIDLNASSQLEKFLDFKWIFRG